MPVQAATRVNRSTGNGVTTVFPYTFKLISQSHIRVTVDGVVKTITTDYTVSGVGDAGGGNVTFTTAPANLAAVVLSGNAPYSRSTDYVRNGSFQEETVDNDFDLAVILIQQLDERQGRAIAIPIDDATGTDVELPVAADRASKYLAFDADGNPVATSGTSSVIVVSTFAETLLDDANAAAAQATLGLVIGTDVQAQNATLQAIANQTEAANKVQYYAADNTPGLLDFKDEDDMASDSDTAVPSQQSVKAYADTKTAAVAASGLAPKAWVRFNGTGTVAIDSSYNVASITDNGTGDYTINFTTPFANTSYCLIGICDSGVNTSNTARDVQIKELAAGYARITTHNYDASIEDVAYCAVVVFGAQ